MQPEPALHRVIPAQSAVKSEWILPYDDVRAILAAAKTFHVEDCMCRVQQDQIGRRCDFPLLNCLSFSAHGRPPRPGDISREEALAVLERAEEIGLVHTVSNVIQGVGYVCNCCGCCCALLRGITDWGIENSVAYANYYAAVEAEACSGCGVCVGRCQVRAIAIKDGTALVDRARCIGCGLCATGCPSEAAKLHRKPEAETVDPPADFAQWECARRQNRGLAAR
ncbi:MAG: 4Fe-4S dicluster domain-containing protein, partial [Bacteroidota bacterium]